MAVAVAMTQTFVSFPHTDNSPEVRLLHELRKCQKGKAGAASQAMLRREIGHGRGSSVAVIKAIGSLPAS